MRNVLLFNNIMYIKEKTVKLRKKRVIQQCRVVKLYNSIKHA